MSERFRCITCEQVEEKCTCERYCYLCWGQNDVRLVADGLFYCLECREACEFLPETKSAVKD